MEFCHLTETEYQQFQQQHPYGNFMSAIESMHVKEDEGWKVEFVGVKENGKIVLATPLTSIPVMKVYRYFYAQRGFLMDYHRMDVLTFFTTEIKKYLKKQKGLYLEVDPNVLYKERDIDGNLVPNGFDNSYVVENMKKAGYIHQGFTRGYGTGQMRWIFSLYFKDRDAQTMLKSFHQQTRWSINRTKKEGVQVRELGLDEVDIFLNMMKETALRRGFEERDRNFYVSQIKEFTKTNHGKLLLAYLDLDAFKANLVQEQKQLEAEKADVDMKLAQIPNSKKFVKRAKVLTENLAINAKKQGRADQLKQQYGSVLNMATTFFIISNGEVVYMHSATNDAFRKFYAPYALQWYMIQYAIDHHIDRYDFYGISGIFDKDDPSYGVYDFKRGFTGQVEELVGVFLLPIHEHAYKIYQKLKG
ncbi:MAG: peptidoglycan bridge formation glycyltransferase FemA/FemB family protein [Absicoccus sp.]|uniref:Aminoacyltransferase n=1 Tax=Absicoccus intestinalis TaxID=2926319 RepID=A0ABU4WP80_9FIRM|nr:MULTISPECIES: peptidoglycan bridge formation glycyltransferase FemA/FemB family protein [unclassified Absicoccus]MDX8418372.1 aminoacyltransferase [Absicoccus sp. CLA-KB-P134]MDY3036373.1 peptidoglycan bridge formation glycyltransferase FemA/FemB family protein [Absicoccus sp.]